MKHISTGSPANPVANCNWLLATTKSCADGLLAGTGLNSFASITLPTRRELWRRRAYCFREFMQWYGVLQLSKDELAQPKSQWLGGNYEQQGDQPTRRMPKEERD